MELPAELVCPLCGYLLEDAVMLPRCAASACNLCAREPPRRQAHVTKS